MNCLAIAPFKPAAAMHHCTNRSYRPSFVASPTTRCAPVSVGYQKASLLRTTRHTLVVLNASKGPVTPESAPNIPPSASVLARKQEGPSSDLSLALPYWTEEGDEHVKARWRLAGVLALTLATTGVSVLFNFLGRDFFNALSAKDQEHFQEMIIKWLIALVLGIPVFVMRDYYQSRLALDWRQWMTERFTADYFTNRTFYKVQSGALLDNPDQRIAVDVRAFTDTTLTFAITLLNAVVDLVSFSEILYSIYPPLFAALVIYSVGGTLTSVYIGRSLVGLNFQQEAQEANFRYGLVRVRENAESIAFYGGEDNEFRLLGRRLQAAVENFGDLLVASRNLNFFTSFYRFLIQILPAAVVAPLYFRGEIEFGVINQSASAFNHILGDVSLVVYQFEALAGFSAVVDRLGEFKEVLDTCKDTKNGSKSNDNGNDNNDEAVVIDTAAVEVEQSSTSDAAAVSTQRQQLEPALVHLSDVDYSSSSNKLLDVEDLTLTVPMSHALLLRDLNLQVQSGHSMLIMGPSGSGKTSLLRTIAGLWNSGSGNIVRHGHPMGKSAGQGEIFFVPQRPYLVLGTLRDQLLYPTWPNSNSTTDNGGASSTAADTKDGRVNNESSPDDNAHKDNSKRINASNGSPLPSGPARALPSDDAMRAVLSSVQLGGLLDRVGGDLDAVVDWTSVLSLGEQQRIAFARVLLSRPKLVLMDESTSALDTRNEAILYRRLKDAGITYVSIGHRPTLLQYHEKVLLLHGDGAGGWSVESSDEVSLEKAVNFMD